MPERFVVVDRLTPMFLPPDLREWVAENDLVRLILEAVEQRQFAISSRDDAGAVNLVLCARLVQLPPD